MDITKALGRSFALEQENVSATHKRVDDILNKDSAPIGVVEDWVELLTQINDMVDKFRIRSLGDEPEGGG